MSLASDFSDEVQDITFQEPTITYTSGNVKKTSYADKFTVQGIAQQSSGNVFYTLLGKGDVIKYDCYVDKDVNTATVTREWRVKFVKMTETIICEIKSLEDIGDTSDPYILELLKVVN